MSEARRLLAFGARLHGAALLAVLLAVADRFVVVTFWDDASLGLYVVALTLATAGLSLITGAFNVLLLPRLALARDVAAQRRIMGRDAALRLAAADRRHRASCCSSAPGCCRSCSATPTPARSASASCSLVAYLPMALRQVIVHGLCGTGDWRPRIVAQALALAAFAALVWPLAALLGLLGIPTALLVADVIALAYLLGFLRRQLHLPRPSAGACAPTTVRHVWATAARC